MQKKEGKTMTLLQLISTLGTQNVSVKVVDADTDNVIIEFLSAGIAGVEGDVSARTVRRWKILGATAIEVVIE